MHSSVKQKLANKERSTEFGVGAGTCWPSNVRLRRIELAEAIVTRSATNANVHTAMHALFDATSANGVVWQKTRKKAFPKHLSCERKGD